MGKEAESDLYNLGEVAQRIQAALEQVISIPRITFIIHIYGYVYAYAAPIFLYQHFIMHKMYGARSFEM